MKPTKENRVWADGPSPGVKSSRGGTGRVRTYRILLPTTHNLRYTNVYSVQGDEGFLLIDCGWPSEEGYRWLKKQLSQEGLKLSGLFAIVLTHHHLDHSGLAPFFTKEFGVPAYLHAKDLELMWSWESYAESAIAMLRKGGMSQEELKRIFRRYAPRGTSVRALSSIHELREKELLGAGLRIVHTPGHTPGHVSGYLPEEKTFFSGDFVLPHISPNVSLTAEDSNPLKDYLNSLSAAEDIKTKLVLPGHEGRFTDLHSRIQWLKLHHRKRTAEILALVSGGWSSPYRMGPRITWSSGPWEKMDVANRSLALGEILAHLRFLEEEGLVRRTEIRGRFEYRKR